MAHRCVVSLYAGPVQDHSFSGIVAFVSCWSRIRQTKKALVQNQGFFQAALGPTQLNQLPGRRLVDSTLIMRLAVPVVCS